MLDTFLKLNIEWTKEVSDWERCRSMSVRIIAVRGEKEPRDLEGSIPGVQGSVPVPHWGKRRGHTQGYIDGIIESIAGYDGARDLGLDAHDDDAWAMSGGDDQNRPPSGATRSDMVGLDSSIPYVGQYEETSSESEIDDSFSPSSPSPDEDFTKPFGYRYALVFLIFSAFISFVQSSLGWKGGPREVLL